MHTETSGRFYLESVNYYIKNNLSECGERSWRDIQAGIMRKSCVGVRELSFDYLLIPLSIFLTAKVK